jgi:CBS domain-containing protein
MKELKKIMQSYPLTCTKEDNLDQVANLMRQENKSFFPVVDKNKYLIGTITYQDICKVVAEKNTDAKDLYVAEAMNYHAQALYMHDDDATAFRLMRRNHVSYLPVVDFDNRLKGIISFFSIARRIVRFKHEFRNTDRNRNLENEFNNDSQMAFH